jgi:hypothetical protein
MLKRSSTWSLLVWTCLIIECHILLEWTGKDVEGGSLALLRILTRHLFEGASWVGGHECQSGCPLPRLAFNLSYPSYKVKASPLQQTFWVSCVANSALAQSSKHGGSGPYGICGRLSRTGTLFSLTTSVFPASYYSRNAAYSSDITGLNSRSDSYNHLLLSMANGSNKLLP